jgi:heat shock protein HslJ
MKKLTLSVIAIAVLAASCVSTSGNTNTINAVKFVDVVPDKEWKLSEVYVNGKTTGFNRNSLSSGLTEMYTISFNPELVSGAGAPNRYTAPYTVGKNQTINIALVRATLMASINEPAGLKEHDFFTYIQNAYKWDIVKENLELYSKVENGSLEIRLVFSL